MSSFSGPAAPLTTVFKNPDSCFKTPEVWSPCGTTTYGSQIQTRCYWSQSASCYPDSPRVVTGGIWGFASGDSFSSVLEYSPGVLPLGYTQNGGLVDGIGVDSASGCLSGFTSDHYCTSTANGRWVDQNGQTSSGDFKAILPQVAVYWASSDLQSFTPASAPILATESLEQYQSSVAARSRTSNSVQSTTPPSQTRPSQSTSSSSSTASPSPGGLSTGAKAGIGVGVALGVLLLLGLAIWFWRRSKKRRSQYKARDGYNGLPYNRGTAEMPNNQMRPKELPGDHELQHVSGRSNAPPIPMASKPRFHSEMEG